jgi:peptide/nickel transport system substrate-binding protein
MLGLIASACASGPVSRITPVLARHTPRLGGTVVLSDYEYPTALSPLVARTDSDLRTGQLLFVPLWDLDPHLRPQPDIARQVPTVANGGVVPARDGHSMSVDVKLLPGLRWSDGQPITADDVIFTWTALTSPANHLASSSPFSRIVSMERRGENEVIWREAAPDPTYLELGAGLFLLPSHRLQREAHGDWSGSPWFQQPDVVSGPFQVSDAAPGDHLTLVANPQYSDGRGHGPYLQRVVVQAPPAKAAEVQALNAGAADVGFHLLPDDLQDLQAPNAAPLVTRGLRDESLYPNHGVNRATGREPPWSGDPAVLEGLDLAVDREGLVRDLTGALGQPARGLYPQALTGFAAGPALPAGPSVDAARRLLDGDGWVSGPDGVRTKGGRRLAFTLLGICGRAGIDHELDRIRRQWLPLGADVTTGCQPWDAFWRLSSQGGFDMTVYSNQWAPDPSAWASVGAAGGSDNWDRCQDSALDAALSRLEGTMSASTRQATAAAVEREWLRYQCTIPLFEVPDVRLVADRLHGFTPNPAAADTWNAANWWVNR